MAQLQPLSNLRIQYEAQKYLGVTVGQNQSSVTPLNRVQVQPMSNPTGPKISCFLTYRANAANFGMFGYPKYSKTHEMMKSY